MENNIDLDQMCFDAMKRVNIQIYESFSIAQLEITQRFFEEKVKFYHTQADYVKSVDRIMFELDEFIANSKKEGAPAYD